MNTIFTIIVAATGKKHPFIQAAIDPITILITGLLYGANLLKNPFFSISFFNTSYFLSSSFYISSAFSFY
jgi:hypothetical protein